MGDDIMEKAFTWTLCFDTLRISQIQNSVKNKATVNVSWVCLYTSLFILVVTIGVKQSSIYMYTYRREASRCSFQQSGQCESH